MEEQDKKGPDRESERLAEERQHLEEEYKRRGAQSISYKDYIAQREKKKNQKKIVIPLHIKFILGTPFLILFGYGIFFIPWIIYVVLTNPEEKPTDSKKDEASIADKKDRTAQERASRR